MTHATPGPTTDRRAVPTVLVLLALAGTVVVGTTMVGAWPDHSAAPPARPHPAAPSPSPPALAGSGDGAADGALPDGATAFDTRYPGVARLDPGLRAALQSATSDAAADGVAIGVTSGWRSPTHQQRLLDEAVSTYGSVAAAERWVATPRTSAHVTGEAVDLAGDGASAWVARHGARYGLCPVYDNEPWHVELRPDAVARGCPDRYADPTDDPRMQH